MVLLALFDVVDDTKLVSKAILDVSAHGWSFISVLPTVFTVRELCRLVSKERVLVCVLCLV